MEISAYRKTPTNRGFSNVTPPPPPRLCLPLHSWYIFELLARQGNYYIRCTLWWLQKTYDLPSSGFFKLSQISIWKQCSLPFLVVPLLKNPPFNKIKGSTIFYNLITDNDLFDKSQSLLKWETDLGKQFSVFQWHKAVWWPHNSSLFTNHEEQFKKLLTRWYFIALQLAVHLSLPILLEVLWICRFIVHLFWFCTLLKPFWDNIFTLISINSQQQCPTTPEFALLPIGMKDIPLTYRKVPWNILHAVHLTIARKGKSINPTSLVEVKAIVSKICIHERNRGMAKRYSPLLPQSMSLRP